MRLRNNFPDKVRNMYFDIWECSLCGRNGQFHGGLELHHIRGRISSSALNCSILCGECHSHMSHYFEEEKRLMQKQIRFLLRNNYEFKENDLKFYNQHKKYYE